MSRFLMVVVASLLLSTIKHPLAVAQPVQARVEKGIAEYQDLEFAAAIATLEAVLARLLERG